MKTKCNKCGRDIEIKSVTCGECNGTLPTNPVAGCEVELCCYKKSISIECGGETDFTEILISDNNAERRESIASYLKACLERGNE